MPEFKNFVWFGSSHFGDHPTQPPEAPNLGILTEERQQFLLHIHEEAKTLLGPLYGDHTELSAATAGSMKDLLLPTNPKNIITVDAGEFVGSEGFIPAKKLIDKTQKDPFLKSDRAKYAKGYQQTAPQHGHIATVNLPRSVGRRAFIIWELEELGVDMASVRDIPEQSGDGMWTMQFDYRHPTDQKATTRTLTYFQSTTSNIAQNKDIRFLDRIAGGVQVILQKASEEAFQSSEFIQLIMPPLTVGGIVIADYFTILKNHVVDLQEVTEFPAALQADLDNGMYWGYPSDKIRIAQRVE